MVSHGLAKKPLTAIPKEATMTIHRPKFDIGELIILPGAKSILHTYDILDSLVRHVKGNWGDSSAEQRQENDFAINRELRIVAFHHDRNNVKFMVITEADRSKTTVLLPGE